VGTLLRRAVFLAVIAPLALLGGGTAHSVAAAKPNIVLILTDDQALHELADMPKTQALLAGHGTTFSNAYVINPLCCPSRATILTGKTSGETDVWDNVPPDGGWGSFKASGLEQSDLPVWLRNAGYQTSLVGKYLNGYKPATVTKVPKAWSDWHALALGADGADAEGKGGYYDYTTSDNGVGTVHGSAESDYSTTVLGDDAVRFVRNAAPGKPLFLWFAPRAPHGPATPEAKYASAPCLTAAAPRTTAFNEPDVSDKPAYIRARPKVGVVAIDTLAVNRCRTLLSVDDQVGRLEQALADTGRLSNTLIVFMSDNGYLLGAHRWNGKTVPYEEATHVPMVIRWDGHVPAGATDDSVVLNLDIARTFAAAAGATSPGAGGADILTGGSHSEFLLEHQSEAPGQEGSVPAYCGVHTKTAVYVQYVTGEQELYDLTADPHETTNLAGDPAHAAQLAQLHADAMSLCVPRPPGWTLP
jgi:N-acetylglucosamine-6-sulfatase